MARPRGTVSRSTYRSLRRRLREGRKPAMLVEFHRRGSPLAELGSRLKFCLGDIIAHYGLQGPPGYAETALHSFPPERRYGKGHVNSKGGCRECARLPMAAERESAD